MKIEGHYDKRADIAWLRFEGYDPATVVAEDVVLGLRELYPSDRHVVGLELVRTQPRPLKAPLAHSAQRSAIRR